MALKKRTKGTVQELQGAITRLAEEKGTIQAENSEVMIRLREAELQAQHYKDLYERERKEREKLSLALTKLMDQQERT